MEMSTREQSEGCARMRPDRTQSWGFRCTPRSKAEDVGRRLKRAGLMEPTMLAAALLPIDAKDKREGSRHRRGPGGEF